MGLRRKQREGLRYTFDEGADAVTFVARPVGRTTYIDTEETYSDEDGKITDEPGWARYLLSTLTVIEGDPETAPERDLTDADLDQLMDTTDWSPGDVLQLVRIARLANESPTGKVLTASTSGSDSSEPPAIGD